MIRNIRLVVLAVLALASVPLIAAGSEKASDEPKPARQDKSDDQRRDEDLAQEVASEVATSLDYDIYDNVNVKAKNGVVVVGGQVTDPSKARAIERLAEKVDGVKEVVNKIEVLPVSISDDRLRAQIASEIFNDPVFTKYAIQSQPPIHIIVKNGRVTLTGVVATELEKRKAGAIASGVFGVHEVKNELEVEQS